MFSLPRLPFELPGFSLPITVPGRIQQRFVSFLLQRFLGHLVKPGQLDASQIDTQIGGGIVEIKRIELDEQVCPLIVASILLTRKPGNKRIPGRAAIYSTPRFHRERGREIPMAERTHRASHSGS